LHEKGSFAFVLCMLCIGSRPGIKAKFLQGSALLLRFKHRAEGGMAASF
jgi:hypothetical protein